MKTFIAPLLFLGFSCSLSASSIVNGGQLLTQSGADQLAAWLGQGNLTLTNVFSSGPEANGISLFHAAVDGIGPTFVVVQTNYGIPAEATTCSISPPIPCCARFSPPTTFQ